MKMKMAMISCTSLHVIFVKVFPTTAAHAKSRKEGETDKDAIEAIQDKYLYHVLKKHMGHSRSRDSNRTKLCW